MHCNASLHPRTTDNLLILRYLQASHVSDNQVVASALIKRDYFLHRNTPIKKLQETVGGITNNQGAFAEEYFFNSFKSGKTNFFGEKFDEIVQHLKNYWQGVED